MNRLPDVRTLDTPRCPALAPLLVVWTRIPKTGSTTAEKIMMAAAATMRFHVFSHGPALPFSMSPEEEREWADFALNRTVRGRNAWRRPVRGVFFGAHRWHVDFAKYATAEEMARVEYVTVTREPTAQLASDFYWRQSRFENCDGAQPSMPPGQLCNHTLASFVRAHGTDSLMKRFAPVGAARFLCGDDRDRPQGERLGECALRNVRHQYAVVGTLESPRATWAALAAVLPGFFGPPFEANLDLHTNENAAHALHADDAEATDELQTTDAFRTEQLVYSTASERLRTFFPNT